MFSRFHHRRGPSNSTPTSPIPPGSDQLTVWEAAALQEKQQPYHQVVPQQRPLSSSSNMGTGSPATTAAALASTTPASSTASPSSNMPPSLPPISRASVITLSTGTTYEFLHDAPQDSNTFSSGASYSAPSTSLGNRRPPSQTTTQPNVHSTPRIYSPPQINEPSPQPAKTSESGFIGGVALANLRRNDLSAAAAAAATVNAAKRPSTSLSMAPSSPTSGNASSPQLYGTPERRMSRSKPPPPPINTNLASRQYLSAQVANGGQGKDPRSGSKSATSFVTPTDLQSSAAAAAAAAASAANLANDAYNSHSSGSLSTTNSNAASAAAAANARTKKSLPFLRKNPVSTLLGRRKTGASSTDIAGMATANADGPVYVPIRGTRVHDFSAPGPRRAAPTDAPAMSSTAAVAAMAAIANAGGTAKPNSATSPSSKSQSRMASPNTNNANSNIPPPSSTPAPRTSDDVVSTPQTSSADTSSAQVSQSAPQPTSSSYPSTTSRNPSVTPDATQNYVSTFPKQPVADLRGVPIRMPSQNTLQMLQTLQENRTLSFDEKPLPDRPATDGSPRTSDATEQPGQPPGPVGAAAGQASSVSVRTASTSTRSRVASADASSLLKSSPSTGTTRSRNLSLSDLSPHTNTTGGLPSTSATTPASVASASVLPKHMKSTSSRFSFMIGSASEEKLLEERHRKKQAEKKATGGDDDAFDNGTGVRDSRFDDFDEDFDYDAMMDDDGLEERIPGVNADDDEYEEDYAHLFGGHDAYEEEGIPYSGLGDEELPPMGGDSHDSVYEDAVDDFAGDDEPTVQIEAEDDDPEGIDPDNDQENFAGFVFQRSNPASSLVSPTSAGIAATPRDALGRAIGFAVTKDATPDLHPPSASLSPLDAENSVAMMMNMKMASFKETMVPHTCDGEADVLGIQSMSAFDDDDGLEQYGDDGCNDDDYGEEYSNKYGDDKEHEDMDNYEKDLGAVEASAEATVTVQPQTQDPDTTVRSLEDRLPGNAASLQDDSYNDDLYYDQGLVDELDFGEPDASGPAFDESIFDLNDTDEYGRPIPGAFAAAQAAQRAAMAAAIEAASGSARRESDVPSSAISDDKSQVNESTAHTSMSMAGLAYGRSGMTPSMQGDNQSTGSLSIPMLSSQFAAARKFEDSRTALRRQLPPIMTDAERVDAYQAALAAAAHKAAASGKFRRDSSSTRFSPEPTSSPPAFDMDGVRGTGLGLQGLSLDDGESAVEASLPVDGTGRLTGLEGAHLAYAFTSERDMDYEFDLEGDNDVYTQDMDDYDFDDAIIAEANAEALANDQDGFYGQEFNFYSAPGQQARNATDRDAIQFANGGYFIPAGVGRSISGRVVSREPNLTPITERSEYSNRNSVMSLAVPPYGSSSELRSPGLAQLAMLADGDNSEMSLSALLRLRSRTFGGGSQASLNSSREGSPMLLSSSYSNNYERDRGDRENASSPFAGPTPSQLLLLQKQYPLPPQYHHRMNSGTSFSPRGAASSGLNSENGSDSGSPTLTSLMPVSSYPGNTLPVPLPTSPIPPTGAGVSSGTSSCPPVLEEEDETVPETEVVTQSDLMAYTPGGVSGISSASESVLWMQSPIQRDNSRTSNNGGGDNSKPFLQPAQRQQLRQKQLHDFEVQALEQQLQVKERETEQIQRQIQLLQQQQQLQLLQQQQQQQADSEYTSPTSPRGPPPPIPPMSSRRPKGHRHKGSSDSISYIREEEEKSGESRWVMERRRLGDTGEVEIEREVVDGI
ncbi:hypothetical protein SEUCBS140593_009071 [Sporothrix eucalyptigena]|uniref:AGC-kinase C-terminal domain-containing protein n=1 Tax=Sporothrix eucalyptigena TaxID=1812306 RepID=A0ABP0CT97_9PEZI